MINDCKDNVSNIGDIFSGNPHNLEIISVPNVDNTDVLFIEENEFYNVSENAPRIFKELSEKINFGYLVPINEKNIVKAIKQVNNLQPNSRVGILSHGNFNKTGLPTAEMYIGSRKVSRNTIGYMLSKKDNLDQILDFSCGGGSIDNLRIWNKYFSVVSGASSERYTGSMVQQCIAHKYQMNQGTGFRAVEEAHKPKKFNIEKNKSTFLNTLNMKLY
jgi:hypothetical protein